MAKEKTTPEETKEKTTPETTPKETPVVPYDPWTDMVTINIPRDRINKEDVQVIVNGRRFVIMRGVKVDVPRPVYDALKDQEEAQFARDAFIEANEIKAETK